MKLPYATMKIGLVGTANRLNVEHPPAMHSALFGASIGIQIKSSN